MLADVHQLTLLYTFYHVPLSGKRRLTQLLLEQSSPPYPEAPVEKWEMDLLSSSGATLEI